MYYYLGTYLTSLFFVGCAEVMLNRNKTKFFVFLSAIALFIPCWLAGIRGETVGTDVMVYAIPQYNLATLYSNFFDYTSASEIEFLYALLVFTCSKLNLGEDIFLFLSQILVILPIYVVGVKKSKYVSLTFLMFVYYFLFYQLTLNMMRQSISCSLIMLAYIYYEEKKTVAYTTLAILAALFHSSALLAIVLFIIFRYASIGKSKPLKKSVLIIATIYLALNFEGIINLIINQLGLLKYEYYGRIIGRMDVAGISPVEVLFRFLFVLIPLIVTLKSRDIKTHNYNFISIMGFTFSFLSLISQYLIRFSYYFQFFFLLTIPTSVKMFTKKNYQRYYIYSIYSAMIIAYWYIVYISWGWYGTMPFIVGR